MYPQGKAALLKMSSGWAQQGEATAQYSGWEAPDQRERETGMGLISTGSEGII